MEPRAAQDLQTQLRLLRSLLQTERSQSFLDLFDEFTREHEFELALHVVCDYSLQPDSPRVTKSVVDQIRRLHAVMKIDDRCVEQLQNQKMESD